MKRHDYIRAAALCVALLMLGSSPTWADVSEQTPEEVSRPAPDLDPEQPPRELGGPVVDVEVAPGGAQAAQWPPEGFEPLAPDAAPRSEASPTVLVVAAYMFVWAALLFYLLLLWGRQRSMINEIRALERRLKQDRDSGDTWD